MKHLISLSILSFVLANCLASCNTRKPAEVITAAEQITTTDSNAIVPGPDSIDTTRLDPETEETALQQDPPAVNAVSKGECEVSFILLSNPTKTTHIYQVNGFDASNNRCWTKVQEHGVKLCNGSPCEVSYLEISNITKSSDPPHYVDAATLKKHGIGQFTYKNSWWEFHGAKIWGRAGKGYEFYNSTRY